jgi:glycosyltransferase involved in cell wall biosynthesis
MKVVLSVDAVHFPLTGIGRYTYELAKYLRLADAQLDLKLMFGDRFIDALPGDALPGDAQGPEATRDGSQLLRLRRLLQHSPLVVSLYRQVASRRRCRLLELHKDAVFHGPNFYLPRFAGYSVVTIHDLSVFSWAHCHPRGRVKVLQGEITRSVKLADMVLTDSEFTRTEVAEFFNLTPDRIRAVPLGASAGFAPRADHELAPVLARWGLRPNGYCLYAGTIEPRKNLDVLLDAYQALPLRTRRRWPLVLCGYQGWQSAALHSRIDKATGEGWARYLGYVSADDLPLLYAGARLFAFPSLYEGFGLPVLEAMASGVPVVCSTSSSLPEVVGSAGAMCAPGDTDALTKLLSRGLEDEDWRAWTRREGLARAASFSWARCARQTLDAYRAAAR